MADGLQIDRDMLSETVPLCMRKARRWLVWKREPNADPTKKPRKVSYYANGQRRHGTLDGPDDRAQLADYPAALTALEAGSYAGLGFALGPDESGQCWQGIDLDDMADHAGLSLIADELPGYTEASPSGRGRHAIGYGRSFPSLGSNGSGIEAYAGGRFFTVTGEEAGCGEPACLADHVEGVLRPLHGQHRAAQPEESMGAAYESVDVLTIRDLRSALNALRADDYDLWIRIGHALKTLGESGRGLWLDWSQTSTQWQPGDAQRWEGFQPVNTHWRSVFSEAQTVGWVNPQRLDQAVPPLGEYDATRPRFRLTPVAELLKTPPPLTWLVRDYLMPESNIFVVGEPAAGKSLLMLDWACCIARGVAWQGHKVQQGAVIYLAGEGHFGLRRRLKAWALHHGIALEGCPFAISDQGASLAESEGDSLHEVMQAIDAFNEQQGAVVLIVVDTLHRNLGSADENSAKDLAVYFRNLDQLRSRYRCAIATVHHTGHADKQRSRGSSAIRGGVDIEFLVTTQGQGISELTCSKMKDAPKPEATAFEIVQAILPWRDDEGKPETSAIIRPAGHKPAGRAGKKMPEGIRYGIESLHRAEQEHGQEGQVGIESWRDAFYARHTGDNAGAKKKAFQRCRKDLVDGKVASVQDDQYRVLDGSGAIWSDAHGHIQRLNVLARQPEPLSDAA